MPLLSNLERLTGVGSRVAVVCAAGALLLSGTAAHASPQSAPAASDKVDCVVFNSQTDRCEVVGVVYAITQVGTRTYIGGAFTSVAGVPRANVAAIGPDGRLDPSWNPSTNGTVYALAASDDGGTVFLGGGFTTVGGQARGRLAAVSADTGALSATWTTAPSNNLVRALVTGADNRLYVGGGFSGIGGRAIPRLASVDQTTGAVDRSFVPAPGGTVRALTMSEDRTRLYAGGPFTTVAGMARPGVAEMDAASGALTGFAPSEGGVVISMDATPSGRLFFGTTSNRTYAYDLASDNVPEYRVRTGGDVQAIYATDTEVYIGGHFNTLPEAKLERVALASFDPANGVTTGWNPGANGPFGVWAISPTVNPLSPGVLPALSIGGDFTRTGGLARRGYARYDF